MRRLPHVIVAALALSLAPEAHASGERMPHHWQPSGDPQRERSDRDRGREEQVERTTRTVRIGANGELDIANVTGDITVTRGSGSDATIEIVKTARAQSTADAREMLGLVQVEIADRAGRAEVRTRYPGENQRRNGGSRNVNVSVAFNVSAPATARVTARSVSGTVSVREIKGDLNLESVSGNIVIAGGARVSTAKTISGDVEIGDTELDGPLEASSVSGAVTIRKGKAGSLSMKSISGDLTVDNVESGRVEAETVSGDVRWSGSIAPSGRYTLTSHSGDIGVVLAVDRGFELDARSFSGSIHSDLSLTSQTGGRAGQRRQQSLHGIHGNGNAVLDITTFSGDITLARR